MSAVLVDTHAIIWYLLDSSRLSVDAGIAIDTADSVYISSISVVEIIYLQEKGRIPDGALQSLYQALAEADTNWSVVSLNLAVAQAIAKIPRAAVPEMPDRIITATALYLNLSLVTCDTEIQAAGIQTIW